MATNTQFDTLSSGASWAEQCVLNVPAENVVNMETAVNAESADVAAVNMNVDADNAENAVNIDAIAGSAANGSGLESVNPEKAQTDVVVFANVLLIPRRCNHARAAVRNVPDEVLDSGDEGEREVFSRTLNMTSFERYNFHPLNVTPDRPCMAYFTVPDNTTTTKEIFDGFIRDGIPANAVRCLQRAPNNGVVVTFASPEYRNKFLSKSVFVVRNKSILVHHPSRRVTYVNVYDAPYELPDSAVETRLAAYGSVLSVHCGKCQEMPDVFNSVRHVSMIRDRAIPCFLRFGRFQVRVKYEGQPKTCRHCGSEDHLLHECWNQICYNCDQPDHKSGDCPEDMRCCIIIITIIIIIIIIIIIFKQGAISHKVVFRTALWRMLQLKK